MSPQITLSEDSGKSFKQKLFILMKLPIKEYLWRHGKLKSRLVRISSPSGNILVQHKEGGITHTKGENPHVFRELRNR